MEMSEEKRLFFNEIFDFATQSQEPALDRLQKEIKYLESELKLDVFNKFFTDYVVENNRKLICRVFAKQYENLMKHTDLEESFTTG